MTLVSVTAYHSFSGEVEASNTPTIRRLTPSCRHQLPRIAPDLTRTGKVSFWRCSQLVDATLYLERQDGVSDDGSTISSRVYGDREDGVMGSLAARGIAESDWAGVW